MPLIEQTTKTFFLNFGIMREVVGVEGIQKGQKHVTIGLERPLNSAPASN